MSMHATSSTRVSVSRHELQSSSQSLLSTELSAEVQQLRGELGVQNHEIRFLRSRLEHLQNVADEAVADREKLSKGSVEGTAPLKDQIQALELENARLKAQNLQMRKQQEACSCIGSRLFKSAPATATRADPSRAASISPPLRSIPATTTTDQSDLELFQQPKPTRGSPPFGSAVRSAQEPTLGSTLGVGRSAAWATRANRRMLGADIENSSVRSTDSYDKLPDEKARYRDLEHKVRVLRDQTPPRERAKLDGLLGKLEKLHTGLEELSSDGGSAKSSPRGLPEERPATPNTLRRMKLTAADLADERRRKEVLANTLRQVRDTSPNLSSVEAKKLESLAKKLDGVHQNLMSGVESLRKTSGSKGDEPSVEL